MSNLNQISGISKLLPEKINQSLRLRDSQFWGPKFLEHPSLEESRKECTDNICDAVEKLLSKGLEPSFVFVIGRPGDLYVYFNPPDVLFVINDYINRDRITLAEFERDERIEIYRVASKVFRCSELYRMSDFDSIEDVNRLTHERTKWSNFAKHPND